MRLNVHFNSLGHIVLPKAKFVGVVDALNALLSLFLHPLVALHSLHPPLSLSALLSGIRNDSPAQTQDAILPLPQVVLVELWHDLGRQLQLLDVVPGPALVRGHEFLRALRGT